MAKSPQIPNPSEDALNQAKTEKAKAQALEAETRAQESQVRAQKIQAETANIQQDKVRKELETKREKLAIIDASEAQTQMQMPQQAPMDQQVDAVNQFGQEDTSAQQLQQMGMSEDDFIKSYKQSGQKGETPYQQMQEEERAKQEKFDRRRKLLEGVADKGIDSYKGFANKLNLPDLGVGSSTEKFQPQQQEETKTFEAWEKSPPVEEVSEGEASKQDPELKSKLFKQIVEEDKDLAEDIKKAGLDPNNSEDMQEIIDKFEPKYSKLGKLDQFVGAELVGPTEEPKVSRGAESPSQDSEDTGFSLDKVLSSGGLSGDDKEGISLDRYREKKSDVESSLGTQVEGFEESYKDFSLKEDKQIKSLNKIHNLIKTSFEKVNENTEKVRNDFLKLRNERKAFIDDKSNLPSYKKAIADINIIAKIMLVIGAGLRGYAGAQDPLSDINDIIEMHYQDQKAAYDSRLKEFEEEESFNTTLHKFTSDELVIKNQQAQALWGLAIQKMELDKSKFQNSQIYNKMMTDSKQILLNLEKEDVELQAKALDKKNVASIKDLISVADYNRKVKKDKDERSLFRGKDGTLFKAATKEEGVSGRKFKQEVSSKNSQFKSLMTEVKDFIDPNDSVGERWLKIGFAKFGKGGKEYHKMKSMMAKFTRIAMSDRIEIGGPGAMSEQDAVRLFGAFLLDYNKKTGDITLDWNKLYRDDINIGTFLQDTQNKYAALVAEKQAQYFVGSQADKFRTFNNVNSFLENSGFNRETRQAGLKILVKDGFLRNTKRR